MDDIIIDKKVITAEQLYFLCLLFRPSGVKAKNLTQYRIESGGVITTIQPNTTSTIFYTAESNPDWELIDDKDNLWFKHGGLAKGESIYTGELELLEQELTEKEIHVIGLSLKAYRDKSEE